MVNALELMIGGVLIVPTGVAAAYLVDRCNQYIFRKIPDYPQFEARQRILFERIKGMEVFPGTLEEFERMKGQSYESIDVPRTEKFLVEESPGKLPVRPSLKELLRSGRYYFGPATILEQAANLGADAIVGYRMIPYYRSLFGPPTLNHKVGLPVKKKAVEVVTSPH